MWALCFCRIPWSPIYISSWATATFRGWITQKNFPIGSHSPPMVPPPSPPKVLFLKHVDTMIKLNSVGPPPNPTLICMWPCEPATWSFGACFWGLILIRFFLRDLWCWTPPIVSAVGFAWWKRSELMMVCDKVWQNNREKKCWVLCWTLWFFCT